ncbi:MAG: aryl-sulfate sulfotransferase [Bryobacteraceae bacterium]|jgi:hypothetical protein
MRSEVNGLLGVICPLAALSAPASATVAITSIHATPAAPQAIGTVVTWTVTATDSNPGPLTFQFNVAPPNSSKFALVRDFNAGTLSGGIWTSQPFVWSPTGIEGAYQIQVVVKDFGAGQTATKSGAYLVTPLVSGSTPVVVPTANPLVALFSAPSCATGSSMRVAFKLPQAQKPVTTNWLSCHPPKSMTFEIAGMYPSAEYQMYSQTRTGSNITNGAALTFTTGALPSDITFPSFTVNVKAGSQTDKSAAVILINTIESGAFIPNLASATDLSGKIIWYYYQPASSTHYNLLTRPLPNGTMLTIQDGPAWNPATQGQQLLRQIDFAGNIVKETNTGVIQQQLLALGAADAGPCNVFNPVQVGSACLGAFHHDAIQTLPNGCTAVLANIEEIFPPGTQGDTSGLPVDIVGDMIIVLNADWQVVWYFDAFQHDSGPPQLDINRPAVLGETCTVGDPGCPPMLLLGPGISTYAKDWLHGNSLYYWPNDTFGGGSGDIVWSSRHQDWVMKVDYNNGVQSGGLGTGNILWRMGPDGDFYFNNVFDDSWCWFSHQHEVGIENNGAGPLTLFDNGNTRVQPPPRGVGSGNSRCMELTFDETNLTVTPSSPAIDVGVFSSAMGSAQLLSDNNMYCFAAIVFVNASHANSYSIEFAGATQVLNIEGPQGYRGWQMPSLYDPPTT